MAEQSSYKQFAQENMSYNTPDGKPVDHRQVLIDLIASQHGLQAASLADSALKHQDKQVKEAMVDHGMTADQVLKTQGIDLNAIANPQKGFLGRWQDNFNKQVGNVTNTDIMNNLLKASEIGKNNQQAQGFNTEEVLKKMSELQNKVNEVMPGYKVDQTAEGNIIIKRGDSDNSEMMLGMKEDQFKTRILQKMGDDLDPSKNVRNPYGVAQLGLSRAERIEGLVSQYKDLNLDRRETEELAIGLNSMLQGSNQSARNQVMSLVPSSARGTVSKLTEWLVNEPQGLNQQKFVQRMLDDVRREKQVFQGQVMKFARSKVAKYKSLIEKYPEETSDILRSFNVDPEAYAKWKDSGFKDQPPIEVSKSDNNVTSSGWDASKEARYQELLKKRGGK